MNASIKTFFAAHKTTIMIASAALVIGAKSFSFMAENNRSQMQMPNMPQQQMMQQPNGQMPQGYNQQMPQQNMNNNGGGFFDSWFGGNDQNENYDAYNNAGNQNYSGYTGAGNAGANYYNPNAGGADYTSNYYKTQAANDAKSEQFSDYMRDQANYEDGYGNTYKLNSGYSNTYVNTTTGEYYQTNDANSDPNQSSTSSWAAVTPSDYSSSSYSSSSYTPAATTTSSTSGDE